MRKVIITLCLSLFAVVAFSQQNDEEAIKKTIATLFDGMGKADTAMLQSAFAKDMVLQSIGNNKDGSPRLITESAAGFIKSIALPHKEIYDERITFNDIRIDGPLAMVWAPYTFYIGQTFSHCGVDVFQLMKTAEGWKIIYIGYPA